MVTSKKSFWNKLFKKINFYKNVNALVTLNVHTHNTLKFININNCYLPLKNNFFCYLQVFDSSAGYV